MKEHNCSNNLIEDIFMPNLNIEDEASTELGFTIDDEHELDYENSRAFYLYLISKNADLLDGCNVVMNECYTGIELKTRKKKEAARKVVRRIVIALYKEWENNPEKFLSISLNNNDWSAGGRYGKLGLTATQLKRVIKKMNDNGFIHFHLADQQHNPEGRKQSRIIALPKLIQTIHQANDVGNIVQNRILLDGKRYEVQSNRPRIILKNNDKKIVKIRRMPTEVAKSERLLERYQIILDTTEIINPETGIIQTPYDKFQYRVFSRNSFYYNGRVHGGFWQTIKKEFRPQILLNQLPTVEVDIKATFPVIIYHELGIDYWQQFLDIPQTEMYRADPYYLEGYTDRDVNGNDFRRVVKVVFNSAINTTNSGENLGWLTSIIRHKYLPQLLARTPPGITLEAAEVISREAPVFIKKFINERHPILREYYFDEANGLQAMNLESKVVLKVIEVFTTLNKPILTIFDSFIVKIEDGNFLKETIVNSYWNVTGFTPYLV